MFEQDSRTTVLFLETSMRIGGTETVISHLMRGLDKKRLRPVLVCLYEPGILGEKLIQEGHAVYHGLMKGRFDFGGVSQLLDIFRKENVDVLFIVNQPLTQVLGLFCAMITGVKARITAIRSTGKINRIRRRLLINNMTFPFITRITALGQMHKEYLTRVEHIDPKKIEIIPNGVNLERFSSAQPSPSLRADLKLSPDDKIIGITAMLRP